MDKIIYDALTRYFNTLATFGYVSYKDVYKIIFLIWVQDNVKTLFSEYITEADNRTIQRALNCMFDSTCLISYPKSLLNECSLC